MAFPEGAPEQGTIIGYPLMGYKVDNGEDSKSRPILKNRKVMPASPGIMQAPV